MGIARSAGRLVGKLVNPSWKPPKPKPAWHENNNKITNIVARHKRGTNDFIVDSKNNNEHDLYIVDHNPDKSTTKYKKVATVGSFTRVDTGNPRTRTQSENPINSENRGISYSGLSAVVEHLRSGGYNVHALNKSNNAKKPVFQGNMVHPLSRHSTTYAENRYENYFRLIPKSDEAKSNDRFWSTQDKPKPQVQKALEYNPSPPKAPPSTSGDKLPRPSDGIRHSQSDIMEWTKKLREESELKKGSPQTNKDISTNVTNYLAKPPKGWPIYPTPTAPTKTKRPVKLDVPTTKPTVNPTVKPASKTETDIANRTTVKTEKQGNQGATLVKKNATAPIELPAKALELPTGKDHLDDIRALVKESKDKAWMAGIARDNLRGSQNPTILDPQTVKKLKNVKTPGFDDLDFDPNSLTPEKLKELDDSVQARALGESNRAAVASGKGMPSGNVVDDVHKYLVPKAQGDDRIEGFQALADRLEALNDPNLSKVIVRLRTSQDNLLAQKEVLADAVTEKERAKARKEADEFALGLRGAVDPTGIRDSSQILNPKTGQPERQVLPLEMSTGAGKDIIEAINKGTGQFNKGTESEANTRGIGLKTLTVPTNLKNPDGSFRKYTEENIPHYTEQLGRRVSDDYQSEQYFRDLAPDAEPPVPTTPIEDVHHKIASRLARLAGLQTSISSMVDNNPNATSDRFAPATPGMIVQSTDSEGKPVSDKPIMNTEEMVKARLHKMEESVGRSESDSYNTARKILAETFNQEDADNLAKLGPKKQSRRIDKMVEQYLNNTVRQHATHFVNPEQDTSGETNIFTANGGVDPRNLISLADYYGSKGHKNPMSKAIDDLLSDDPATKNIIQQINAYDRESLENQFSIHQAGLAKNPDDPATQNAAAGVFNHMAQQGYNTEGVSPFVKDISAEEMFALAQAEKLAKFNAPPIKEAYVQTEPVPVDVPVTPVRSGLASRGKQSDVEQAAAQASPPTAQLTPDAISLLDSMEKGNGVPTFITNNLRRIAEQNGVAVTGSMTANDVINALKAKAAPEPQPQADIGNKVQNYLPQDPLNPAQTAQESARAALNDPTVAPPAPAPAKFSRNGELAPGRDLRGRKFAADNLKKFRSFGPEGRKLAQEARRGANNFSTISSQDDQRAHGILKGLGARERFLPEKPEAASVAAKTGAGRDVGIHFGDGNVGRDTTLSRMDASRSTGHFGTGVYFLSSIEKGGTLRSERPVKEIDLTGLKLARPIADDGQKLHDGLREFNRAVFRGNALDFSDPQHAGSKAVFDINAALGSSKHSEAEIASAMKQVEELFSKGENDKVRTPSTYLMQVLGYDGIDVRGSRLDNTAYGSVVFQQANSPPQPDILAQVNSHIDSANPSLSRRMTEEQRKAEKRAQELEASQAKPKYKGPLVGKLKPDAVNSTVILAAINQGRLPYLQLPKTISKANQKGGEWDDKFVHQYWNRRFYKENGVEPTTLLQSAIRLGILPEGSTTDDLWQQIRKDVVDYKNYRSLEDQEYDYHLSQNSLPPTKPVIHLIKNRRRRSPPDPSVPF